MKHRVFFVGMHYKPNKPPLCSTTPSGKVIDSIISGLLPCEVVRTNLCYTEYFPEEEDISRGRRDWPRFNQTRPGDVVVLLGAFVHRNFPELYKRIPVIKIAHPSSSNYRSNDDKARYIAQSIEVINRFLTPPTSN